jgi:hypothetical protein
MGEDSRAYTVALLAVIKTTSKQQNNNLPRKKTGIDREFSDLCEVCSVKLAIKCFPFVEQVRCRRCFPWLRDTILAPAPVLGIPLLALHRACGAIFVMRLCKRDEL